MAFAEVCPERYDLIHPHYRRICRMLIDTDEWGQIAIMNLFLRYARTQFVDPNAKVTIEIRDSPHERGRRNEKIDAVFFRPLGAVIFPQFRTREGDE
jgi:AP-3 complex subunit beta